MNCHEAQESVLDSLVETLAPEPRMAMEQHIAGCGVCSSFALAQRTLDLRLAAALPLARLSPGFRASFEERLRRETTTAWPDFLPDLAHVIGCAFAAVFSFFVLPREWSGATVAGVALTYVLQGFLRISLDELDGSA